MLAKNTSYSYNNFVVLKQAGMAQLVAQLIRNQ